MAGPLDPHMLANAPKLYVRYLHPSDVFHMVEKFVHVRFGGKEAFYGSADITNYCNLKCSHCYWWVNRRPDEELTAEQWRDVVRKTFKKNHVIHTCICGGEPLLRPDVIDVFLEEMPKKCSIVTNGTLGLKPLETNHYFVSIDGPEEIHDRIRGPNTWRLSRKHIQDYVDRWGNDQIVISHTVNAMNYMYVEKVLEDWHGLAKHISFQFYTPYSYEDPLWFPFGKERDALVEKIKHWKDNEYLEFISNTDDQLNLFKEAWGKRCPYWSIISLDHMGRIKYPCYMGSSNPDMIKPICERCGVGPHSIICSFGVSDAVGPFIRNAGPKLAKLPIAS